MKCSIKILLFLLFSLCSVAQQNPYWQEPSRVQADSFRIIFQKNNNDSLQMYACRELGLYYQEINRDSSLYFYEQQLLIAQKLKLKIWEAEALNRIGYISGLLGNYARSLKVLLNAKEIAANKETGKKIWNISLFSKAENPEISRLTLLASIAQHLGILYVFTGDLEQALPKYFECRKIAESINDKALLSLIHMNIGEVYINQNKPDSALVTEEKAFYYSNESGYTKYKGFIQFLIGKIHESQNKNSLAKKYYYESVETSQNQKSFDFLGMGYISLANLLMKEGNIDSSLFYGKQALKNYENLKDLTGLLNVYDLLSAIYKSKHNIDSAFYYRELANIAKDSLNKEEKIKNFQTIGFKEQLKLQEFEKERMQTQNKIRTYAMLTGIAVFMLIAFLLYRNNRNRRKANTLLKQQKDEIENTLTKLKSTQAQLIQSEKMASLGELTAGIAHEIQNPLNFVNNFSEVNKELIAEMKDEIEKGNYDEVKALAKDVEDNEDKINHHGKRADAIVKGMLQHSRSSTRQKEPTNINALTDEYLRLAYHGFRAKDDTFNATMKTDFDESIGSINIIPQDIGRVLLNLYNNAFYAAPLPPPENIGINSAGVKDPHYKHEPTVWVSTKKIGDKVLISVRDNGPGIPQKVVDKIFQPFFTTKPTGQGTGLGLSLSYDIVKAHGGEIKVESKEGEGAAFIIQLPVN